jgi:hypothetical protein
MSKPFPSASEKHLRPNLKNKLKAKRAESHGSTGRVIASQVGRPEFKPQERKKTFIVALNN